MTRAKKNKSQPHQRSAEKKAERAKHQAVFRKKRQKVWERQTVNYTPRAYKNTFATGRTNSKRVTGRLCIQPSKLEAENTRSRIRVHNPHNKDGKGVGPRLLFTRFPKVVKQNVVAELCRRIAILRCNIPVRRTRDGRPKFGRDLHRKSPGSDGGAKHPASHQGVWQPRTPFPRITAEFDKLSDTGKRALNNVLEYARDHILTPLSHIIEQESPEIVETMTRVRCYILKFPHIRRAFRKYPGLNMGRLFTTVAISERGSEKYHIDWLDDPSIPAWVIPLGSFGQAYVCFSQLHKKFSVRSGDVCGMASRHLVHRAQVLGSGHRDVLTMFTHRALVKAANDWWNTLSDRERATHLQLMKSFDPPAPAAVNDSDLKAKAL